MGKRRAKLKACDPFNPNRKKKVENPRKNMPIDDTKKEGLSLSQKRLIQSQRQLERIEQRHKDKKKNRRQEKLLSANKGARSKPNAPLNNNKNNKQNNNKPNNNKANNNNKNSAKQGGFEFAENGSQPQIANNNNTTSTSTKEPITEIDPTELEMKPWESFYQFKARVNVLTREVLKEKDRGISETLKQKNKKIAHSDVKKQREQERKEKKMESRIGDFDQFQDHIQFGEVVDRPPDIQLAPRFARMAAKKKAMRPALGVGEPMEKRRQLELMRDKVVQAYAEAKKRRREEQANALGSNKNEKRVKRQRVEF